MIIGPECDKRGPIPEDKSRSRSEVYRECADLSAESFRIYADKIGAVHHYSRKQVLTEGKVGSTTLLFEVLRLIYDPIYDEYDKVLFCDTDIVCNTEENIFDLHKGDVSGVAESDIVVGANPQYIKDNYDKCRGGYASWDFDDNKYWELVRKYQRLDIPVKTAHDMGARKQSKVFVMNTGVHIWSKEARLKAREQFDDWYEYMADGDKEGDHFWLNNDQPYISGQLVKHNFKINHLDQTWNDTPTHYTDGYPCWTSQNFLHYTGGGGKVTMLQHQKEGKFKYV